MSHIYDCLESSLPFSFIHLSLLSQILAVAEFKAYDVDLMFPEGISMKKFTNQGSFYTFLANADYFFEICFLTFLIRVNDCFQKR